ncbi:pyrimidine 5'-nucleotidase [Gilbertella persicaria]|nr:pyrimidine 5'-nucleotidase [Gilbertella persicaria]KAI8079009.1 pyrimidine 5'-nucleotidase [Gilbertella persicaria]
MTLKPIFFFDLDNCLYDKKLNVLSLMRQKIREYFVNTMGIPAEEVAALQMKYMKTYGTSLKGLQKEYHVDPIDYDQKVDQALPLDGLINKDEPLREMLHNMNCKKWVFTNAYRVHAVRCLKLLGIENEFDGLTYANYAIPDFNCKPDPAAFMRAMKDAGAVDPTQCYLVDDSAQNIDAAQQLGWTTVHLADDASQSNHGDFQIDDIHDLYEILPEFWEPKTEVKIRRQSLGITAEA